MTKMSIYLSGNETIRFNYRRIFLGFKISSTYAICGRPTTIWSSTRSRDHGNELSVRSMQKANLQLKEISIKPAPQYI
jgi:hypothetical protein